MRLVFFSVFLLVSSMTSAWASNHKAEQDHDTSYNQIHHFFNAELLNPNEKQISLVGNIKFRFNDSLEFGTQGLLFLGGMYNFYLKHRMFSGQNWRTSFVNHSFFTNQKDEKLDPETLQKTTTSSQLFIAALGVVTTHDISHETKFSWGLYDLYLNITENEDHLDVQGHLLSPSIALDYRYHKNWALTATLTYAAYVSVNIESDIGDTTLDATLFDTSDIGISPMVGFLTTTYHYDSFNIEMGFVRLPGLLMPYLNLFWRLP